ncbi:MAG: hypothetical protein U1E83_01040 [Methylotetracoccus sp.]
MAETLQSELTEVHLHGALGARFGRLFRLDVRSAVEALQALRCQLPGFNAALRQSPGFVLLAGEERLTEAMLALETGRKPIHVMPVLAGATGIELITIAGIGAITLGDVILTVSIVMALVQLGLGLANMSSDTPKADKNQNRTLESYSFNGPVNTVGQGAPVPVGYGRLKVGGHVISSRTYAA